MGFKHNSVVSFRDKTDVGINRVPIGSLVEVHNFDGVPRVYILNNDVGVHTATTIEEAYDNENLSATINFIEVPTVTYPTYNEIDVPLDATFTSGAFTLSDGVISTHLNTDWEIATDVEFTNIIFSAYDRSESLNTIIPTGEMGLTSYYVRVRYKSAEFFSNWSSPVYYTTETASITAPEIILPQGDPVYQESFTIETSDFVVLGGTDTHDSTSWEILNSAGDTVIWSSINNGTNLVSIVVPEAVISTSENYIIRVTHNGSSLTSTSGTLPFATVPKFVVTPILAGTSSSVDENTQVIITISNYDATVAYNVEVTEGNYILSGDTIRWNMPEVISGSIDITMGVYVVISGYTSEYATKVITVDDVPVLYDDPVYVTDFTNNEYNNEWSV